MTRDPQHGDTRLQQLTAWVATQRPGANPPTLVPLDGDAGFRRYFRLAEEPGVLAVDSPPATEHNAAFVAMAALLRQQGVRAPQVFAQDAAAGFLLLEDLGDTLLWSVLNADNVDHYYGQALAVVAKIQACPQPPSWLPPYDAARLHDEMALFPEWFCEQLLGCALSPAERADLQALFADLVSNAEAQPQVLVHRDYHSRNLLLGEPLGVVDFQDAVWGPLTYDPVSLLKDCYVRWPAEQVWAWALAFRDRQCPDVDDATFQRWFEGMGLQRHLKVLGIFARLWLRDGKPRYLNDLPLVIRYTLEAAAGDPAWRDFGAWFQARLLPACERQPWYRPWASAEAAAVASSPLGQGPR